MHRLLSIGVAQRRAERLDMMFILSNWLLTAVGNPG
jgi:hypothetical protein